MGSRAFGVIGELSVLNGHFDLARTMRERWRVAREAASWLWSSCSRSVGRDDVSRQRLRRWAAEKPTFVVLERRPVNAADARPDVAYIQSIAGLVRTYPRPGGASSVAVYRVTAPGSE